jgi:hypothetical protein
MAIHSASSESVLVDILSHILIMQNLGSMDSPHAEAKNIGMEHVEQVHTNELVPANPNYYEKNGVRTEGDGLDHEAEPKMSFARMMSIVAMAFCMYRSLSSVVRPD